MDLSDGLFFVRTKFDDDVAHVSIVNSQGPLIDNHNTKPNCLR